MNENNLSKRKHVLILEGYCKQTLPFIRGFKELGCEVTVLCGSKLDCGYASRLPDHKIIGTCDLHNHDGSELYIVELVKTGKFDIVFPPFDFSARILAEHKKELSKYAYICVNDKEVFNAADDKEQVMRVCMENGIPCPKTIFNVKKPEDIKEKGLAYPLIIKPRQAYGGRGFHMFDNEEQLTDYVNLSGIKMEDYVVQEKIPIDRIGVASNLYIDREGNIKSFFSYVCKHMYPEIGGTSTLNAMIDRPELKETCEKLVKIMNLRGIVGIDIMIDSRDNIGKVIEINVRPSHGIAIGFKSGFNLCQQILEDFNEQPVTLFDTLRTDFCMRISQTDFLWFLTSANRFKKSPRKMGYKKVYDQMFFWDDPMPWFAFLIGGLKDMRRKIAEKKK